jgi:hypothetical protein
MAGASYDDIADALGYAARGGAHKAVMAAIDSTLPEPAAKVRELELKRLDRLWLAVWDAATKGDIEAIDACVRIMKRRADFEGLDKAKKHEHFGPDGGPVPIAATAQVTIYIPDNERDPCPARQPKVKQSEAPAPSTAVDSSEEAVLKAHLVKLEAKAEAAGLL